MPDLLFVALSDGRLEMTAGAGNRRLSLCLGLTPASQPRAPPLLALLLSWPVVMYSASGVGREQGVSLPINPHPVDRSVIAEVGHATVNEVLQSTRSESGKGGGR
jgi:hypothetical protein